MVAVSTADGGTANDRLVVQISGFSYQTISPYLAGTYRGTPVSVSVPLGATGLYRHIDGHFTGSAVIGISDTAPAL